jgi:hypothetical protein
MLTTPKHGDATSPSYARITAEVMGENPLGASPDELMTTKGLQKHVQNSISEFQAKVKNTLDALQANEKTGTRSKYIDRISECPN